MIVLDSLILGDNQFFGINHMSQEKAQQLAERFNDLSKVYKALHIAHGLGIRAFMLNSNDKAGEICDYIRAHRSEFLGLVLYPSIPYPHKYANLVAERGILGAVQNVLSGQSAMDLLGFAGKGLSLIAGDINKVIAMLVDVEMKIYRKLDFNVIYLQNIITDLILGLEFKEVFVEYCRHVERKYEAAPGFLTMNVPRLGAFLQSCGVENAAICGAVNKRGYLMSPSKESYEAYFKGAQRYPVTAMSIFASGAISAPEAVDYICQQGIRSIVFGASTEVHIKETMELVLGKI